MLTDSRRSTAVPQEEHSRPPGGADGGSRGGWRHGDGEGQDAVSEPQPVHGAAGSVVVRELLHGACGGGGGDGGGRGGETLNTAPHLHKEGGECDDDAED